MKKFLVLLLVFVSPFAYAKLRLPNLFGDHMVLQTGKPVTVWGWGTQGKEVEVQFAEQKVRSVIDEKGVWSVELPAFEKSFEGRQLVVVSEDAMRTSRCSL